MVFLHLVDPAVLVQLHLVQVLLEHCHVLHEHLDLVVALLGEVRQELVELGDVRFNFLQRAPQDRAQVSVDLAHLLLVWVLLRHLSLLVAGDVGKLAGLVGCRLV